jgi:hypothetical protein
MSSIEREILIQSQILEHMNLTISRINQRFTDYLERQTKITECALCYGQGVIYYGNEEDYTLESCPDCNYKEEKE